MRHENYILFLRFEEMKEVSSKTLLQIRRRIRGNGSVLIGTAYSRVDMCCVKIHGSGWLRYTVDSIVKRRMNKTSFKDE